MLKYIGFIFNNVIILILILVAILIGCNTKQIESSTIIDKNHLIKAIFIEQILSKMMNALKTNILGIFI